MSVRINQAFANSFEAAKLTFGLTVPIESYERTAHPTMERSGEIIQLAETLGFSSVWLRDIPFNVKSFGDIGQIYDPWTYLGYLSAHTSKIGLGIASLILPLRHPAHIAKAAASIDQLSQGRLLLGVASGDRPDEYPAMNIAYEDRAARFRDSVAYIKAAQETHPTISNSYGTISQAPDILPKPYGSHIPILVTGSSRQETSWIAANSDGWIVYPRDLQTQAGVIEEWQQNLETTSVGFKPILQSLYIDLLKDDGAPAHGIHLGYSAGVDFFIDHFQQLRSLGINHVILNLRFCSRPVEQVMKEISDKILPLFH